jgi:hypothetical protein
LNEAVVERSSSVTKSPIASTSTTRSAAGGGNDPFSFDGFGDDEPEGPDAPHVWVRLPADERPEGVDFIADDGHGRPVLVGETDGALAGRPPASPGLVKARLPVERWMDDDSIATAVAARIVAQLAKHSADPGSAPLEAGRPSDARPVAMPAEAPAAEFMKIADYARRTGYSVRTIENFLVDGLPTVGERRLRRVDVEPADECIRTRAARELDHQDAFEREVRDNARRGRSARSRRG